MRSLWKKISTSLNIFLNRQHYNMKGKKTSRMPGKEKIIKASIFSCMGIIVIIICIAWFSSEKQFTAFEQNKISTYGRLGTLIEKIISTSSQDSLIAWSNRFNRDFYDGETIPREDSATLLAMRRFRFELNDKLSGTINILEPTKFEKTGRDIIQACQVQVVKLNNGSSELAKND